MKQKNRNSKKAEPNCVPLLLCYYVIAVRWLVFLQINVYCTQKTTTLNLLFNNIIQNKEINIQKVAQMIGTLLLTKGI